MLGFGETEDKLAASFTVAARYPLVKGFAVGRTIFTETARNWILDKVTDDEAVVTMANNYQRICSIWVNAKQTVTQA